MPNKSISNLPMSVTDLLTKNGASNVNSIQAIKTLKDWLEDDELNTAFFIITISNHLGVVVYAEGEVNSKRGTLIGKLKMYHNEKRHVDPNNPLVVPTSQPPFDPAKSDDVQLRIKVNSAEINLEADGFEMNLQNPEYINGTFHGIGNVQDEINSEFSGSSFTKAYFTLAVRLFPE